MCPFHKVPHSRTKWGGALNTDTYIQVDIMQLHVEKIQVLQL